MKRHPSLSLKKPDHLQESRKTARNAFVLYDFYDKVKANYEAHGNNKECGCFV